MQIGGEGILGTVIWFLMFFVLIFVYPRLMLSQMTMSLEKSARKLEALSAKANTNITKSLVKNPNKELKSAINEFTEFFVITPSSLDPYGIVKKIDVTIKQMEERFTGFVDSVAKNKSKEEKDNINYGFSK